MPTEKITVDGQPVETLRELLRPGLRAVFVGINPAPDSVRAGHYYQGQLGRRFWQRLKDHGIAGRLPPGREDETAFAAGLGFADVVRQPTRRAEDLPPSLLRAGVSPLVDRLVALGKPRPIIVFTFKKAESAAGDALRAAGFLTYRMPGPYAATADAGRAMRALATVLADRTINQAEAPVGTGIDLDMHALMVGLSKERPIFHNEAEFQHALAWHIHTLQPDRRVRLEARLGGAFVDLWLPDTHTAVELKFGRHNFETVHAGEIYDLRTGAADVTAYSFVRDIERLESLAAEGEIATGFAGLLSNDPWLWTPPQSGSAMIFDAFRLHDTQPALTGRRSVTAVATPKIAKAHPPVTLAGSYAPTWRAYAEHTGTGRGVFRYLTVKVQRGR